jgi:hypothetical protein
MADPCFTKKDSNPPACGVHNVPLVPRQTSDHSDTSGLGTFTYLVCPVSGAVVRDTPTRS